ncbi:MAG: sigma-E factor negative regulatory protein [Gammaproteobacteria bacterium]
MSDRFGEQISALVDDELDDSERVSVFDRLRRDPELLHRWERYHFISDVMKNKRPVPLDGDFARRVSQALEAEPALLVRPARRGNALSDKRYWAGLVVAASVAAVAVLGARSGMQEPGETPVNYAASAPADTVYAGHMQSPQARWDSAQPEVETRLNYYLVNHSEYSSVPGMHGRLPYMRMAGYESK